MGISLKLNRQVWSLERCYLESAFGSGTRRIIFSRGHYGIRNTVAGMDYGQSGLCMALLSKELAEKFLVSQRIPVFTKTIGTKEEIHIICTLYVFLQI